MTSGVCAADVGQMGNEGCPAVIDDWNGAVYDLPRHRLVFTGGGHAGYFGNELYALRLDVGPTGRTIRLNDPTPNPMTSMPWGGTPCQLPTLYWDGRPNQVHNYGGIVYVPSRQLFWQHGGAGSPCGFGLPIAWSLNLANLPSLGYPGATRWTRLAQTGFQPYAAFGGNGDGQTFASVYDPMTDTVVAHTQYELVRYDFTTDRFTLLTNYNTDANAYIGTAMHGVLDPARRLLVMAGGGAIKVVNLASPTFVHAEWTVPAACATWAGAPNPGLAYDPVSDKVVGTTGRSNVLYVLDTATRGCTAQTFPGATVPTPRHNNGVFGRFQYLPDLDAFLLLNDPYQDALLLRTR